MAASEIPSSAIRSAAAWLGCEQQKQTDWIHILSRDEDAELEAAIRAHGLKGEPLTNVNAADYKLPRFALRIDHWMRELDDGRGFILVRGFPAAEYSEDDAAFAYWLIGLHMGRPVPQNRKGGRSRTYSR